MRSCNDTRKRFSISMLAWTLASCLIVPGCSIYYRTAPTDTRDIPVHPLAPSELALAASLRADVEHLSNAIGPRALPVWFVAIHEEADSPEIRVDQSMIPGPLDETALWIEGRLRAMGYTPERIGYEVDGVRVWNIEVVLGSTDKGVASVVVGAHYDTLAGTPGADDNASAVAALLALADRLRDSVPKRTLRLVWFVNEEQPFLRTRYMGSRVYAESLESKGIDVAGMICLDMLGYYDDAPGSQRFPSHAGRSLPDTGDFIGFVAARGDYGFMRETLRDFRASTRLPAEGIALRGDLRSDHWWFVELGVPSVLVTDTAEYRNPHYHEPSDTPETLDYERLALCVVGLEGLVKRLAGDEQEIRGVQRQARLPSGPPREDPLVNPPR